MSDNPEDIYIIEERGNLKSVKCCKEVVIMIRDRSYQQFPTTFTVLTIEVRGMSKVTKTILILQLDSWIAAHFGASCCSPSTCGLLSPLCRPNTHIHTVPPSYESSQALINSCDSATLSHCDTWVELHLVLKCAVPADGVWSGLRCAAWLLRPAEPDHCFPLNWDVSASCPAVQTVTSEAFSLRRPASLHFTKTLVGSHSNQEDPVSLCRAGKRRRVHGRRRLIWMSEGGVRESPGSPIPPGACGDMKCSYSSVAKAAYKQKVKAKTHLFRFSIFALWWSTTPKITSTPSNYLKFVWWAWTDWLLHSSLLFGSWSSILYVIFNHCFAQRPLNNAMVVGQNKERNNPIMAKWEIPFVYWFQHICRAAYAEQISTGRQTTSLLGATLKSENKSSRLISSFCLDLLLLF